MIMKLDGEMYDARYFDIEPQIIDDIIIIKDKVFISTLILMLII